MYVKELQKYIDVDVYGDCGPLKCSKSNWTSCNVMMQKNYKFFIGEKSQPPVVDWFLISGEVGMKIDPPGDIP